jgi:Heterokaryon incompatibility protein (HET)
MDSYEYDKLDLPLGKPIRLVRLEPSLDPESAVFVTLETVDLRSKPTYEALSYVWGDSTKVTPITVCGHIFQVTLNLEAPMKRLRATDKPRFLWIDAICINQINVSEKNRMVMQMGDIYNCAQQTLVWLGEPDRLKSEAGVLQQFRAEVMQRNPVPWVLNPSVFESPQGMCIETIFGSAWWRRGWVVQEVAHAHYVTVFCGSDSMEWSTLRGYMSCCIFSSDFNNQAVSPSSKEALYSVFEVFSMNQRIYPNSSPKFSGMLYESSRASLCELLEEFRNRDTTNPRDKVYSLLSIADDSYGITVDYSQPVDKFLVSTARTLLQGDQPLQFLRSCKWNGDDVRSDDRPSWMPDWSEKQPQDRSRGYVSQMRGLETDPKTIWDRRGLQNPTIISGQELTVYGCLAFLVDQKPTPSRLLKPMRPLNGKDGWKYLPDFKSIARPAKDDCVFLIPSCPSAIILRRIHEKDKISYRIIGAAGMASPGFCHRPYTTSY